MRIVVFFAALIAGATCAPRDRDLEVTHHSNGGGLEVSHHGNEVAHHGNGRNCLCPADYSPVCGEDIQTYANLCVARCNGQMRSIPGSCEENFSLGRPRPIPDKVRRRNFEVVHHNGNQVVHHNGDEVVHHGRNKRCVCAANYAPVCGSDTRTTYSNDCQAYCSGESRTVPGPCDQVSHFPVEEEVSDSLFGSACVCPAIYDPVCGGDRRTYASRCLATCNKVTRFVSGACNEVTPYSDYDQDLCDCDLDPDTNSFIDDPVCGDFGETYPNICEARCRGQTRPMPGACFQVSHHGNSGENCRCPRIVNRVCGNDGVTYDNACLAECGGATTVTEGSCEQVIHHGLPDVW